MFVVKRNGNKEPVAFEKVQERIAKSAEGLSVNAVKVAQGVLTRIVDGITTTELDIIAANLSFAWSTSNPDYGVLASRIAISNHQKNTPTTMLDCVSRLENVLDKLGESASLLDSVFVKVCTDNAVEIEERIDYSRDFLLDYFGFKTLERAYLLRDTDHIVVERPQHLWMRVAIGLWTYPDGTADLVKAFETYDMISRKLYTHATPTLFNAGTKKPQLSSCFLLQMKSDSIHGIYDTLKDCALISQYGGGIGIHASNIRAQGSLIRGTGGISNGIVPMLRVFNNTARYVDQCFTPETLVYVNGGGMKKICDIDSETDTVLTSGGGEVNDEATGKTFTGTLKPAYKKVQKRVEHLYSGTMVDMTVECDGQQTRISVTPKHPFLSVMQSNQLPDYHPVCDLRVGNMIVHPSVGGCCIFTKIVSMVERSVENQVLYDLEVEGTHDYTVCNVGIAHNGGGKRNGSFAIYMEPWHADIEAFLEMKKNTGSEEERARDLFYALWIPDLFMERVDANGDWTLFCPNEAPGLSDAVGDDFKALYERYESEGKGKKTVKAQELWFHILDSQIETGTPYLCYKDAANLKSNQKNLGTIKSSNLCVAPETRILTKDGEVEIASVVGQEVEVWNGRKWSKTTVTKTGENQPVIGVDILVGNITDDGSYTFTPRHIECTPYHKFIMKRDDEDTLAGNPRVDARDLTRGMNLIDWCDEDGTLHESIVWGIQDYRRTCDTYCFNEPENHAGVFNGILTGNCTEIIEYSSPTETAVCNLASMSLPAFVKDGSFDFAEFRRVVKVAVRNLNRVIDVNYYPIPEARNSNMRHRPIGLGVQGLSDVFAMLGLPWESEEAAVLNRRIFAHMYYAAVESSCDLAAVEGRYETFVGSPAQGGELQFHLWKQEPLRDEGLEWDQLINAVQRIGLRNSLLVAPMPTASTSQILGNCECIEPYATHIFARRTLAGEFIVINKHLVKALQEKGLWSDALKDRIIGNNGSVQGLAEVPEDIQHVFKTVWEIKQKVLIDMAADRGPYVCQSQSLNLFMGDPDYRKLTSMHFYAWRKGLKTGIYYLRTKAVASAQKFTVEPSTTTTSVIAQQEPAECLMCSS